MTLLVAMFAVAGCVYMLESVFVLNVVLTIPSVKGFASFLSAIEFIDSRVKFGKQEWLASTHYI